MAMIPQANELTIDKLSNVGWVMTDTCNTARKYHSLIVETIKQIAEEEGIQKDRMKLFESGKVIIILIVSSSQL